MKFVIFLNQDFGVAKKYINSEGGHIPEGQKTSYGTGTLRFTSAYAASHLVASRRDDLEAIGFMLMSFLRGDLPWDHVSDPEKPIYRRKVVEMKLSLKNVRNVV